MVNSKYNKHNLDLDRLFPTQKNPVIPAELSMGVERGGATSIGAYFCTYYYSRRR